MTHGLLRGGAVCLLVLAPRLLPRAYWFELGLLNYGFSTANTPQGFMLLRIVDPELKSGAAEDYAVAAPLSAPFIGGGVVTFVLPWVLAMVAIPLEMLLDSARHVLSTLAVLVLEALASLLRVFGHVAGAVTSMAVNAYDVYIGIPLRIENAVRAKGGAGNGPFTPPARGERAGQAVAS